MTLKCFQLAAFVGFSLFTFSQQVEKKFVNKHFIPSDSINASYVRLIKRDTTRSDRGMVVTCDLSGNVLQSIEYSSLSQKTRNGESISYYTKSTQKRSVQTYLNNQEDGFFEYYFHDGSLQAKGHKNKGALTDSLVSFHLNGIPKRLEKYLEGELVGGNCFDTTGSIVPFYPFESEAEFPGGNEGLMEFIRKNIIYPSDAIELNVSGKVYARFVVDSLGNVSDIEIEKGVSPSIDKEVIRVIQIMPNWLPSTFDGNPVSSVFRLPVNFELDGGVGDLTCMDTTLRRLNLYWKSQSAVLYDAFSGESIPSFSRGKKSYFKLYLLHPDKGTIRRKKTEFFQLEYNNAYKFNSRRHAKRFRQFCM
jgi:protein TonB